MIGRRQFDPTQDMTSPEAAAQGAIRREKRRSGRPRDYSTAASAGRQPARFSIAEALAEALRGRK